MQPKKSEAIHLVTYVVSRLEIQSRVIASSILSTGVVAPSIIGLTSAQQRRMISDREAAMKKRYG